MIKRLAKCIREYKMYAILAPIAIILEVVMEVLIPKLMASLIDKGIDAGNMVHIWKMGGLLVLAALVSLFFGAFAAWSSSRASAGFARNIRHDLFYKVQTFSFTSIDKFSPASIVTRLTTDVTRVQMAFMMVIRMALRAPFMLIFALVMSFSINVKLSLIFLVAVPILAFGMSYISLTTHPIFRKVFETYDKLNLIVQENLRGIRVVKSFVREDHEIEKFENVSGEIYKGFTRAQRRMAGMNPLMQFSMYLTTLLLSWFGARLIVNSGGSDLSVGNLTSIISYAGQILSSLMMVSMSLVQMIMSRASAQRIIEVLNEGGETVEKPDAVREVPDGSICFENVDFSYDKDSDNLVLKKINLDIESGQTIGILGGTGSAKSTLVQLIPRLYDVTDGSIKVGGIDVRDYDLETLRNAVAMVLQKNELFSGTIRENIRWGDMDATDEEIEHVCKLAQADGFIRDMPDGYDTVIEQGGTNVSGGQKQRLCIARALLKHPKILILDDSTSAVDTRTDALIQRAFNEEIPNTTKLIIAQRVASVQNADRIIVMDNGYINGYGTHEELLASNDIYREVYESQLKGMGDYDE